MGKNGTSSIISEGYVGNGAGGKLAEGLYISDSSGNLTYFGSGTAYEGVTFQTTYSVYWFEVDADGNQSAITEQGGNALSLGENLPIIVLGTGTYPSINLVMYRYDSVTFDTIGGDFTYSLSDLSDPTKNTASITGGAWNETLPLDIVKEDLITTYQGGLTPPEGDYELKYRVTDPNGDFTDSLPIVNKWAPHVMINGYRVTGVDYILDVEPPVELAGYDSIDLQYILGGEIATDGSGSPIYGAGGEIGYIGGTLVEELAVAFVKGDNEFIIANISDDYGNTKSSYPFDVTRMPALRYDGLTTVDEETYGTTYDGALSLIVDEGLAEEINVTPDEAPYSFTSGDYRNYNFTASYTYSTGQSNSVPVVIEYVEFANLPLLTEKINEGIDLWIDGEANTKIGTQTLALVDSPDLEDNQTDDVYLSADNDYKTGYVPKLGKNIDSSSGGGCKIDNSGGDLLPTSNYTLTFTEKNILAGGIQFAFAKGINSEGFNNVHGMYYSTDEVAFRWYGNNINTGYLKQAIVNNYAIVNDADNNLYKLYVNGDLKSTTDTSSMTPYINAYNIAFQGFLSDATETALSFANKSNLTNIRIANYAFTDADAFAEYRNHCKGPTVVATGDSNLEFGTDDNYFNQVYPALVDDGICGNTVRLGRAGATFYESVRTGYTYKISDGGYVPDVQSRPAPDANRNMDYIRDYLKADIIHILYTGNYTNPDPAYVYGTNGYDDPCYGEYIRAIQDCESFCDDNDIVFMPSTPFPLDTTDTIANSSTLRRDCGKATADQLLISGVKNVLDFFSTLADPDNTFKSGYTYDGTHLDTGGTYAIAPILTNAIVERFRTRNPVATITNPQNNDFILTQPLDTIDVDWVLDEGIPKNITDQEVLSQGINTITRSGLSGYGFPYSDSVSVEYGEVLQNQLNHYLCDQINAGIIADQEGVTDLTTYGNDALVDGYWDIRKSNDDYGRIFGSSSYFQDGNARTYSMWVKPTGSLNALHIFGQMPQTDANKNFIRTFTDGSLLFFIGGSPKGFGTLVVNQWTHIVWVFDGAGNDWAYVDNIASTTRNHGSVAVSSFDVNVGASMDSDDQNTAGPQNGIDGQIRDIRIIDRAISQAEVNYLYTNNY